MSLVNARPPDEGEDAPPGFYEDPFGGAKLREWNGTSWTEAVRKSQLDDALEAAAYSRCRLLVPRPPPFADPYRVVEEDGRESFTVPGGRWFYRQLCVCDPSGAELLRLRRNGHWWWPESDYMLLRGDSQLARFRERESRFHWPGMLPAEIGMSNAIFVLRNKWTSLDHTFIQKGRIVARLIDRRRLFRLRSFYDLELAQDADPLPFVAAGVALDRMNRQWLGTGGGG